MSKEPTKAYTLPKGSSVNLLLPVHSALEKGDEFLDVTTFRMKKLRTEKKFKVQLFNKDKLVEEIKLTNMSLRIKTYDNVVIIEIADEEKVVMSIQGTKFLSDERLKDYVKTLVI